MEGRSSCGGCSAGGSAKLHDMIWTARDHLEDAFGSGGLFGVV